MFAIDQFQSSDYFVYVRSVGAAAAAQSQQICVYVWVCCACTCVSVWVGGAKLCVNLIKRIKSKHWSNCSNPLLLYLQFEWFLHLSCAGQLNRWPCHWISGAFISTSSEHCRRGWRRSPWDQFIDLMNWWFNDTVDYFCQIEKRNSWHWGLVTDSQRVPWTVFTIIAIFSLFMWYGNYWQSSGTDHFYAYWSVPWSKPT